MQYWKRSEAKLRQGARRCVVVGGVHFAFLIYACCGCRGNSGWGSFVDNKLYNNYIGLLDGVLNFEAARLLEKYANAKTAGKRKRIKDKILKQASRCRGWLLLATFLDNHDMERFLFRCGGDVTRLKKAATLQFSLDQPATIYYGTEIGLSQNQPFSSRKHHADILARQPMEWDTAKQNAELLAFYKTQIHQRASGQR